MSEESVIHKQMPGIRWMYLEAKCGERVYHGQASRWWKDVTCDECLALKEKKYTQEQLDKGDYGKSRAILETGAE